MCCDFWFSNDTKVNNISRTDFEKRLRAALHNNSFNFEGKIYKLIDEVAMRTALRSYFGKYIFMFS